MRLNGGAACWSRGPPSICCLSRDQPVAACFESGVGTWGKCQSRTQVDEVQRRGSSFGTTAQRVPRDQRSFGDKGRRLCLLGHYRAGMLIEHAPPGIERGKLQSKNDPDFGGQSNHSIGARSVFFHVFEKSLVMTRKIIGTDRNNSGGGRLCDGKEYCT